MSKIEKNKWLIIVLYFLSLMVFELITVSCRFDIRMVTEGYYNFFSLIGAYFEGGIYHFLFVSCLALYAKYSKNIKKEYKNIFYWFPLCTFIFTWPMVIPTSAVIRVFNEIF